MKQKLAILLWSLDPETPDLCATPFVHAAVAAAMDCQVELYFSGMSVRLLAPGIAAQLYAGPQREISVYRHMQQAHEHGAVFIACHDALAAQGLAEAALIGEVARNNAGAAAFVARLLDPSWATLVF